VAAVEVSRTTITRLRQKTGGVETGTAGGGGTAVGEASAAVPEDARAAAEAVGEAEAAGDTEGIVKQQQPIFSPL
jgi:hypothetical protein